MPNEVLFLLISRKIEKQSKVCDLDLQFVTFLCGGNLFDFLLLDMLPVGFEFFHHCLVCCLYERKNDQKVTFKERSWLFLN
ncbi:hypothetical protein VSVS12_01254 [Vibrio scophthalmi]|nr:hypothetical protein VSVS12_01254 [Vibrio scophthalmi]